MSRHENFTTNDVLFEDNGFNFDDMPAFAGYEHAAESEKTQEEVASDIARDIAGQGIEVAVQKYNDGAYGEVGDHTVAEDAFSEILSLIDENTDRRKVIGQLSGFDESEMTTLDGACAYVSMLQSGYDMLNTSLDSIREEYQKRREFVLDPGEKADEQMQAFMEATFSPEDCAKINEMVDMDTPNFITHFSDFIIEKYGLEDFGVSVDYAKAGSAYARAFEQANPGNDDLLISAGAYEKNSRTMIINPRLYESLQKANGLVDGGGEPIDETDLNYHYGVAIAHELYHARQDMIVATDAGSEDGKNLELNMAYYQEPQDGIEAYEKQLVERQANYIGNNLLMYALQHAA
jgi:hypothetical protein